MKSFCRILLELNKNQFTFSSSSLFRKSDLLSSAKELPAKSSQLFQTDVDEIVQTSRCLFYTQNSKTWTARIHYVKWKEIMPGWMDISKWRFMNFCQVLQPFTTLPAKIKKNYKKCSKFSKLFHKTANRFVDKKILKLLFFLTFHELLKKNIILWKWKMYWRFLAPRYNKSIIYNNWAVKVSYEEIQLTTGDSIELLPFKLS